MRFVEKEAALRMADAATLLLDVARDIAKQSPKYVPGKSNERDELTIATQALFGADFDLRNYGVVTALDATRVKDRMEGMAAGLGVIIGSSQSPAVSLAHLRICQGAIARGLIERVSFNLAGDARGK